MNRVKFFSATAALTLDKLSDEINNFIDEGSYDLISVSLTKTDDNFTAVVATVIYDDRRFMNPYKSPDNNQPRMKFNG